MSSTVKQILGESEKDDYYDPDQDVFDKLEELIKHKNPVTLRVDTRGLEAIRNYLEKPHQHAAQQKLASLLKSLFEK